MKYRVTQLPNTGKAKQFRIQSDTEKKETSFSFSKEVLTDWGNPLEPKLKETMIAYVKRNGWAKENVTITPANSQKNLNAFIASLSSKSKSSK